MSKLFNMDNPFWTFWSKMFDALVLHVMWLAGSLGIVTIGASTSALYYVLMKDLKDEAPHYVKMFWKAWKENMKQGIILSVIFLGVGAMLVFAFIYYLKMSGTSDFFSAAMGIFILLAVIYLFVFQYAFPLQGRFENSVPAILKNALILSVKNIGWTLLMTVLLIGVYFVIFYFNFVPLLIFGYGMLALVNSYMFNHIFKPFIPEEEPEDEGDPDAWELPETLPEEAAGETVDGQAEMLPEEEYKNE